MGAQRADGWLAVVLALCSCAAFVGCGASQRTTARTPQPVEVPRAGADERDGVQGASTWTPVYRLTLLDAPNEGEGLLEVQANVHNGSAQDWVRVPITLTASRAASSPRPLAPDDQDGDGVRDDDDLCVGEAEDRDSFEDADGCPDPDNDQDRILDGDDHCPNEAELYNGTDDEDGCPDQGYVLVSDSRIVILDRPYFRRGSSELDARQLPLIDAIAATLTFNPQILRIELRGHCSDDERDAWALSAARAAVLRAALVARGVAPERLVIRPFGSTQPVDAARTAAARERNRRVELEILETTYDHERAPAARPPVLVDAAIRGASPGARLGGDGPVARCALASPVTLRAGSSALLPVASARGPGELVYLFRPDPAVPGSDAHPFRAVRFVNRTGLALAPGPISIVAHGAPLGDGQLPGLAPDELATLPYALDASTTIAVDGTRVTEPAGVSALAHGNVTLQDLDVVRTRYAIDPSVRAPQRIFIRHARLLSYVGRELPPDTEERTEDYLLPVPLDPGRDSVFVVEETRAATRTVALDIDLSTALEPYLEATALPVTVLPALRAALARRAALAALEREIEALRARLSDAAIRSVVHPEDLHALSAELGQKTAAAAAVRSELSALLAPLTLDPPAPSPR